MNVLDRALGFPSPPGRPLSLPKAASRSLESAGRGVMAQQLSAMHSPKNQSFLKTRACPRWFKLPAGRYAKGFKNQVLTHGI